MILYPLSLCKYDKYECVFPSYLLNNSIKEMYPELPVSQIISSEISFSIPTQDYKDLGFIASAKPKWSLGQCVLSLDTLP